jgi:hypothetical protein
MDQVHEMVFDGEVLRPVVRLDLEPNVRYRVVILPCFEPSVHDEKASEPGSVWAWLDEMEGTVDGPGDWSAEVDHYLYGTPKRGGADGP